MEQTGTILFRIVDFNGQPISKAEIVLNYMSMGITDQSGILTIGEVPIGISLPYFVAAIGYNRPSGYINITATYQEQTVKMEISPPFYI